MIGFVFPVSEYIYIYLSIYLSIHLSIHVSINLSIFIHLFVYLSFYQFISFSIYLSINFYFSLVAFNIYTFLDFLDSVTHFAFPLCFVFSEFRSRCQFIVRFSVDEKTKSLLIRQIFTSHFSSFLHITLCIPVFFLTLPNIFFQSLFDCFVLPFSCPSLSLVRLFPLFFSYFLHLLCL